ncbi:hypothetical protein HDE_12835 [Halotydeus destructor]|nr:hypothetical protein HDE_12835 [Halotydeus destructor]
MQTEVSELKAKYNQLNDDLIKTSKDNIALAEQLIGLTKVSNNQFKQIEKSHQALLKYKEAFQKQLGITFMTLSNLTGDAAASSQALLNLIEALQASSMGSAFYLNAKTLSLTWQAGLAALREGRLPETLLERVELRKILEFVSSQLPPMFGLALPITELDSYYDLRLARHFFSEDDIYVRLVIPLTRSSIFEPKTILVPKCFPFATPSSWKGNRTKLVLTQLEISGRPILTSSFGDPFKATDLTIWDCRQKGSEQLCQTFFPHALEPVDKCLTYLLGGDFTNVATYCDKVISPKFEYKPISLGNGRYMLHREVNLRYIESCPEVDQPIIIPGNRFAIPYQLKPGCVLNAGGHIYPGLIISNTHNITIELKTIDIQGRQVNASDYVKGIAPDQNNLTLEFEDFGNDSYSYDPSTLTSMVEQLNSMTDSMKARVALMESRPVYEYESKSMTIEGIFDVITTAIVYLLMIATIRQGAFQPAAPAVILIRSPSHAFELGRLTEDTRSWFQSFSLSDYWPFKWFAWLEYTEYIIPALKLLIVVSVLLLILFFIYKRKVRPSAHLAIAQEASAARFFLVLTGIITKRKWTEELYQVFSIYMGILDDLPVGTIRVEVSNPAHIWIVRKSEGYFETISEVTYRGIGSDGRFTCSKTARFRIKLASLIWREDFQPAGFEDNAYGCGFLASVGDPTDF